MGNQSAQVKKDTIADFGEQWTRFTKNTGYYANIAVFKELLAPFSHARPVQGLRVADVGAGTGRYTQMLYQLGAAAIDAYEPSQAVEVLRSNCAHLAGVQCLQMGAHELPAAVYDMVFCIGVLQFIPDDAGALRAMRKALKPGGQLLVWVYAREGNGLYLAFIKPVRWLAGKLPKPWLQTLCSMLLWGADAYAWLCKKWPLPLPLKTYMTTYFSRMDKYSRSLIIFDQLNPSLARYYTKQQLQILFEQAGFKNYTLHHHRSYSWTVLATVPIEAE